MSLSDQQYQAVKAVRAWLDETNSPQIFRLFGYAGTGKTTIAKELAEQVDGRVEFACFTGKAALVLRKKGCRNARTLHGLIYNPITLPKGKVEFVLKDRAQCDLVGASLLIVDEVSMVGHELAKDLLSFGCKVLVLGDPAQLPPVSGEGFFINAEPGFMLTEVHRQAVDNPIIRMSMDVRNGNQLKPGAYGESLIVPNWNLSQQAMQDFAVGADQVLCGTNAKRIVLNSLIRKHRGLIGDRHPDLPAIGDRLVCLKNKREKALFNGGIFEVESVDNGDQFSSMMVKSLDDERDSLDVKVPVELFMPTKSELKWYDMIGHEQFTYGWGLTVHKSQGSQWDNVVVFDESRSFREHARNHLYTAITRAAERVTVIQ